MAKKKKVATKRTKVKALQESKRELTGKDMRKVKGGADFQFTHPTDKSSSVIFQK